MSSEQAFAGSDLRSAAQDYKRDAEHKRIQGPFRLCEVAVEEPSSLDRLLIALSLVGLEAC